MAFARHAQETPRLGGSVVRLPGWLVFVVFVPLQIWLFLELRAVWGIWWTILFFLVLGFLGTRAARAAWLRAMFFPAHAERHERRRHAYQGILFLAAGATWLLPQAALQLGPWVEALPQPWLPLAFLVTLLKSAVR